MSINVRQTKIGVSYRKQSNLATAQSAGNMWGLTKTGDNLMAVVLNSEDDSDDMGKGDEFPANNFLTNWDVSGQYDKYLSSQWFAWAAAFCLGDITQTTAAAGPPAAYQYVCIPRAPADGIECDSFTIVEQLGGVDRALVGCCAEGMTLQFNSGPGRANAKLIVDVVGTGKVTSPSSITVPATLTESFLNAGGATVSFLGETYSGGELVSVEWSWKNNIRLDTGFFIGSGTSNGGQLRGRMETNKRECSMRFRVRLESGSGEEADLLAQTEGAVEFTITGALITGSSYNSAKVEMPRCVYSAVQVASENGLAVYDVTVKAMKDPSEEYVTLTAITTVANIGQ